MAEERILTDALYAIEAEGTSDIHVLGETVTSRTRAAEIAKLALAKYREANAGAPREDAE